MLIYSLILPRIVVNVNQNIETEIISISVFIILFHLYSMAHVTFVGRCFKSSEEKHNYRYGYDSIFINHFDRLKIELLKCV